MPPASRCRKTGYLQPDQGRKRPRPERQIQHRHPHPCSAFTRRAIPTCLSWVATRQSFQFNLTDMLHSQGDHIAACIDYVRRHDYQSLDVTSEAEEWWRAGSDPSSRQNHPQPGLVRRAIIISRANFSAVRMVIITARFPKYVTHLKEVRARMTENFTFTTR